MKSFILSYRKVILIMLVGVVISLLGYHLRLQQFSAFPPIGDTRDEVKSVFNGISLIKRGVPESWSWWDDYGEFPVQNIRGSDYRLVKPWFEEPPLFGSLLGSYAIWKGMDSYEKVDAGALRWPMLKIGAFDIFLLFILVYLISGFWEATVASLIYATVPTIVLSSRLPLAENFLITLFLLSLLLFVLYLKKNSKLVLLVCSLTAGVAILVKQTGVYIPATIFFLLIAHQKIKPALQVIAISSIFLLSWFAFGYYYNWSLFIHLQGIFSGREIRLPSMIINLFDTFRISEKTMSTDGWMIWGWISVVAFAFLEKIRKKKLSRLVLSLAIGSYLVVFAVMSGHSKGWYRFPFHPFLSWAIAAVFINFVKEPSFLYSFFFVAIAGFASLISGTGEAFWSQSQVKVYQFLLPLSMTPALFYDLTQKPALKRLSQFVLIGAFLLMIYFNVRTILFFQDQFWY